jgi:dephospho-CoA kinase
MHVVAVTGGVASGKSTLLKALKGKKFPTFNCDDEIAKLYQNPEITTQITNAFPSIFPDSKFNKTTLKQEIAKNNSTLKTLQKILYPHLNKQIANFTSHCRRKNYEMIFIENPLVFESRKTHKYDAVIITTCPIYKRKMQFQKRNLDPTLWKIASQNQWQQAKKLGTKTITKKLEFSLHSIKFQNKEIQKILKKLI